jgi:hypothetical protein
VAIERIETSSERRWSLSAPAKPESRHG